MRKQPDTIVAQRRKIPAPNVAKMENIVYANHCQIVAAVDEAHLCFGIVNPLPNNDDVKYTVDVITSWSHLKRVQRVIGTMIENHEKIFGEIVENPVDRVKDEAKSLVTIEER